MSTCLSCRKTSPSIISSVTKPHNARLPCIAYLCTILVLQITCIVFLFVISLPYIPSNIIFQEYYVLATEAATPTKYAALQNLCVSAAEAQTPTKYVAFQNLCVPVAEPATPASRPAVPVATTSDPTFVFAKSEDAPLSVGTCTFGTVDVQSMVVSSRPEADSTSALPRVS